MILSSLLGFVSLYAIIHFVTNHIGENTSQFFKNDWFLSAIPNLPKANEDSSLRGGAHLYRQLGAEGGLDDIHMAKVLQEWGGPLCKDHILPKLRSTCQKIPCVEYNLWYDDVYHNSTSSTEEFHTSKYSKSLFADKTRRRVVLSLGHDGFQNNMFQHSFAQQVAKHVHAPLYATTVAAFEASSSIDTTWKRDLYGLDSVMMWSLLPENHPDRELCRRSNMTYSKRPKDDRDRKGGRHEIFNAQLKEFLDPNGTIDCLITFGYFHHRDTCVEDAKQMWKPFSNRDFLVEDFKLTFLFRPRDIAISFSCDRYGFMLDEEYIGTILNRSESKWDRVVIMKPQRCRPKSKDWYVIEWLHNTYSPKIAYLTTVDDYGPKDLAQLILAPMLIEDRTAFSYWATLFSNATVKHSNVVLHGITRDDPAYEYHNPKSELYFLTSHNSRNETSQVDGVSNNFTYSTPILSKLQKGQLGKQLYAMGGPLCQDNSWLTPSQTCLYTKPCGEYDLWYNDVYKGFRPAADSSEYRESSYFKSPYTSKTNDEPPPRKVVVSLAHNGFGNVLFEHYFAQRIAEHMHIPLYMSVTPHVPWPPNTHTGLKWNAEATNPNFLWSLLPEDHPDKELCRHSNFTYARRPVDLRAQKGEKATEAQEALSSFLDPHGSVRCLLTIGYFQHKDVCVDTTKKMWPALSNKSSPAFRPDLVLRDTDIAIHFRCEERHYGVPDITMIETILNNTDWERIVMVMPPGCHGGKIKAVINKVQNTYKNSISRSSADATGFEDFITLVSSNKLIEDRSTYSYWAGVFSNGVEKHVMLDFHGLNHYDDSYIYHDIKNRRYYLKLFNGTLVQQSLV